jgi:hypothetical protein
MKKIGLANARVSKILNISKDFQAHRNNIAHISNRNTEELKIKKYANKMEKMREERSRYYSNSMSFKLNEQQRENKLVERLDKIHHRDPKHLAKSNSNQILGSIRINRISSSKTLNQNFRRSESKRIIKENDQLASRIVNSIPKPYFALDKLKKEHNRGQ